LIGVSEWDGFDVKVREQKKSSERSLQRRILRNLLKKTSPAIPMKKNPPVELSSSQRKDLTEKSHNDLNLGSKRLTHKRGSAWKLLRYTKIRWQVTRLGF